MPPERRAKSSWFLRLSKWLAVRSGRSITFVIAVMLVLGWIATGPLFDYSDTWQLVINTTTTIITFLMVFLIQSTQNRDTEAIQIKLDEIIRATQGAHNALLDLEELSEEELDAYRRRYEQLASLSREKIKNGQQDIDVPELKDEDSHAPVR